MEVFHKNVEITTLGDQQCGKHNQENQWAYKKYLKSTWDVSLSFEILFFI